MPIATGIAQRNIFFIFSSFFEHLMLLAWVLFYVGNNVYAHIYTHKYINEHMAISSSTAAYMHNRWQVLAYKYEYVYMHKQN